MHRTHSQYYKDSDNSHPIDHVITHVGPTLNFSSDTESERASTE